VEDQPHLGGEPPPPAKGKPLRELAFLFLRLGATAFGGPAAHIAMMEDEVVVRRKWLSRGKFLDLIGATNLIPGPNSTEMAIHVGYLRAGFAGLLVAGTCFIIPATIIVGAIAWAYVQFGKLPEVGAVLYGVKPVVIAVVAQALWRLGRSAIQTKFLLAVAIVATALGFLGVNELVILFGSGVFVILVKSTSRWRKPALPALVLAFPTSTVAAATGAISFGLWPLFLVFLKAGALLFGSGYVLLAFLRADLVERLHWLTESQLLDAVAVGQVTPGPVFTTATFVGYILGGVPGAIVATVGIFLPAFFFVGVTGPLVPRLRKSRIAGAALDGVNVGALAMMATVTWYLGRAAIIDLPTIGLAIASAVVLLRFRLNAT
jgi:chromate transporter